MDTPRFRRRPSATTFPVDDLVAGVLEGQYRLPEFQRPPRWGAQEVVDLFDSVWKGFPIGTLLLWKRRAPEAGPPLQFGNVVLPMPAREDAFYVVDGQQRIRALVNVLAHPSPSRARSDMYALWFDLVGERFVRAGSADIPVTWIPLNRVLDAVQLGKWFSRLSADARSDELETRAHQLGKTLREYQVPACIVDTEDVETLRVVFARLNTSGKGMRETEVFGALNFNETGGSQIGDLRKALAEEGMGEPEDAWAMRMVRAVQGDDLTTPIDPTLRAYGGAWRPAATAGIRALAFLREAGIPHLRLLPYRLPLVILTRFFHLHPDPDPRHRMLLRRWLWRGIWGGRHRDTQNPHLRWIRDAIGPDEHGTVSAMLADVGRDMPNQEGIQTLVDTPWRFSSAASSLMLLILANQGPLDADTGTPISVSALLQRFGAASAPTILPGNVDSGSWARVLHEDAPDLYTRLVRNPEIRGSHLLPDLSLPTPPILAPPSDDPEYPSAWLSRWREDRRRRLIGAAWSFLQQTTELGQSDHLAWGSRMAALGEEGAEGSEEDVGSASDDGQSPR